jgi:Ni/Co efflux regulator RcnB
MKKIMLLVVAIATITTLSLPAADEAKPKAKVSAEDLKKYDKNGDGKLDKDERAALKADKAKEKKEAK